MGPPAADWLTPPGAAARRRISRTSAAPGTTSSTVVAGTARMARRRLARHEGSRSAAVTWWGRPRAWRRPFAGPLSGAVARTAPGASVARRHRHCNGAWAPCRNGLSGSRSPWPWPLTGAGGTCRVNDGQQVTGAEQRQRPLAAPRCFRARTRSVGTQPGARCGGPARTSHPRPSFSCQRRGAVAGDGSDHLRGHAATSFTSFPCTQPAVQLPAEGRLNLEAQVDEPPCAICSIGLSCTGRCPAARRSCGADGAVRACPPPAC
jgi:hypothetical protein